jgi:hypothetical protein
MPQRNAERSSGEDHVLVIGPRLIAAALEEKNFIRLLLVTGGILSTIVITDLSVLVCVRASVREREYAQTHMHHVLHHAFHTHTHNTHTHTHLVSSA